MKQTLRKTAFTAALCSLMGVGLVIPSASAEDGDELSKARADRSFFSRQQEQLNGDLLGSDEDLKLLEAQVAKQRNFVRKSLAELNKVNAEITQLKYQRGRAMEESYISADNENLLFALVDSGSLSEFLKRGQYTAFLIDKKEALVDSLDERIVSLDKDRRDLVTEMNGMETEIEDLEDQVALLRLQLETNKDKLAEARAREAYLASLGGFLGQNDRDFLKRNEPVGGRFAFGGGGWGHGLGMSQFGARGAARKGKDYKEILRHYYQGTSVEKRSGTASESYLARVVTAEMGSGPIEAIKAQAVAARTYAYTHSQSPDAICTPKTQACAPSSNAQAREAVRATRGEVVIYQGRAVEVYYHSSSGGWTENNENVWGGSPRPWLRGVPSPWETDSPHWYWETRSYSRAGMEDILRKAFSDLGRLETIRITGRGVSGRVTSIEIHGSAGVKRISGPRFVSIFNTHSPDRDCADIYSGEPHCLRTTLFGFR